MLDHNLRAATILGFVGAGGVGYDLITAIRLFQYDRLILMILAIYLLVTGLDRLSSVLRRRII
jgi:phosphonate transport system permease protein